MPKLVLIEPKAPNLHIFSRFYTPRLGSFILGALMKERGWDVEVMIEETDPIDFNDLASADWVGLSTITPTAPRAYAIAKKIKELYPRVQVVMGGPHVTYLPEEALDQADFVIRGEGEDALVALADAWEGDGDFSVVPNLSYKLDDAIVHNPMAEACINLDRLPLPDF